MNDTKLARDMARIEESRRRTQERLEKQQQRVNERYERMHNRLVRRFGEPSTTQQRIIKSALEILKEDGLANITLRGIATRTEMKAPALYWHFMNKEVLVDYMAEAILEKEFTNLQPKEDDELWQDWLTNHMIRLRKAMLAYPDGARVVAGAHLYPAVTLAKSLECGLISLNSAGIELKTARQIITTATSYTFGYVIEEQAAPTEKELKDIDLDAFLEPYPNMAKALDDVRGSVTRDEDFLSGLGYIIAGAELNVLRYGK